MESPAAGDTASGAGSAFEVSGSRGEEYGAGGPGASEECAQPRSVLAQLYPEPIWGLWRERDRDKLPLGADGKALNAAQAAGWMTRDDAEIAKAKIGADGFGIRLGLLPGGSAVLGGCDLDDCADEATGEPDARAGQFLRPLKTWVAPSPSERGFRALFLAPPDAIETGWLGDLGPGIESGKPFGKPEIALFLQRKFMRLHPDETVTQPGAPTLRLLERELWKRMIRRAGELKAPVASIGVHSGGLLDLVIAQAARAGGKFAALFDGTHELIGMNDRSRIPFALAHHMKAAGFDQEQFAEVVLEFEHTADWAAERQQTRHLQRDLKRCWDRSSEAPSPRQGSGGTAATLDNLVVAIQAAPEWAGVFRLNVFAHRTEIHAPLPGCPEPWKQPRPINDLDSGYVQRWFERQGWKPKREAVERAIAMVASENRFDPVKGYLADLRWDHTSRLSGMLHNYFRVQAGPDERLVRAYSRIFMIGAVARAMKPGCKLDTVLVLEGEQGIRKSSALAALVGEAWFTDDLGGEIGSKDASQGLQGKWGIELAEMVAHRRADIDALKAFLTRQSDHFRMPYGRDFGDYDRSCFFVGTINPTGDGYFKDTTGNRRYMPVRCAGTIDTVALARDRDQLWAEAVHAFQHGEPWHLTDVELVAQQAAGTADRLERDPMEEAISRHVASLDEVTTFEIAELLVTTVSEGAEGNLTTSRRVPQKRDQMRASDIMKALGWEQLPNPVRRDGQRVRAYRRTERAAPKVVPADTRDTGRGSRSEGDPW